MAGFPCRVKRVLLVGRRVSTIRKIEQVTKELEPIYKKNILRKR